MLYRSTNRRRGCQEILTAPSIYFPAGIRSKINIEMDRRNCNPRIRWSPVYRNSITRSINIAIRIDPLGVEPVASAISHYVSVIIYLPYIHIAASSCGVSHHRGKTWGRWRRHRAISSRRRRRHRTIVLRRRSGTIAVDRSIAFVMPSPYRTLAVS